MKIWLCCSTLHGLLILPMMKEADLHPPEVDLRAGQPLQSTEPLTTVSSNSGSWVLQVVETMAIFLIPLLYLEQFNHSHLSNFWDEYNHFCP